MRNEPEPAPYKVGAVAYPRGHILHDFLEARVFPQDRRPDRTRQLAICGDVEDGAAHDQRPVKFGTILPELLAASVEDEYYKDPVERTWAFSDALNAS